jgi:transcriptional regulator NrdR family protein
MIMHRLKKLDKVAYVRFASVYMDFMMCRIHERIEEFA